MQTFVFSKPQEKAEDLVDWMKFFTGKGVYSFIHEQADGKFVLVREGKERDTSMECDPVVGPCIHCGKNPPHALGHYKFCNDECMDAEVRCKRRA